MIFEIKYIIAASSMVLMAAVILYVAFILYKLLKRREGTLDVNLPNLDEAETSKKEIKPFEGLKEIEVQLVDPYEEERILAISSKHKSKDVVSERFGMETGEITIPEDKSGEYMPELVDEDIRIANEEARKTRREKEQEAIRRIKELALEDDKVDDFEKMLQRQKDKDGE